MSTTKTSQNTILEFLAVGGLGAVLTACSGSSNGPNGKASTAATTAPTTTQTSTTPVTTGTVVTTPSPSPAPATASSKFLFTCNYLSDDVSVWNTAPTVGTLTSSVAAPLLTQSALPNMPTASPVWMTADATGSFVFVADAGTNTLDCFNVDRTTGALTHPAAPGSPTAMTGIAPYSVIVDPTSKFVYTANIGDNTVSAFTIQAGGSLAPCTTPSLMVGQAPSALAMDPTGKFVYVANTNDSTLSVLSIDATGNPKTVGAPIPTGIAPFSIASVNTGTGYVYVANNVDSSLSVFDIGAAGALTAPTTGATVLIPNGGIGPSVVAADPSGSFLYVVDGYDSIAMSPTNDIAAFSINAATGALAPIGTSNTAAGISPTSLAFNSSGLELYVSDGGGNAILTFGITPVTGALITEGTTPAGNGPTAIVASN